MPARHTIYTISPSPDSALVLEVWQKGWSRQKHLFAFEQFAGELKYDPEHPTETELSLLIQANSLTCRQSPVSRRRREKLARFALREALAADRHPELRFDSDRFRAKPLRGFVVEGCVRFRGQERPAVANIGFGVEKKGRLQIDADATLQLSDWQIEPPRRMFGLIRTENAVVLHALLWGERQAAGTLS